jgi:CheY-like chemotaxis protein
MEPTGLGEKGWDLVDQIKLDPTKASIPIVICTTQNIDRGMMERDVIAYLVKPVIPMDLHELIREILSQIQNPSFTLETSKYKRRQLK